jgi:S-formylglutathione hydrolase FrmB
MPQTRRLAGVLAAAAVLISLVPGVATAKGPTLRTADDGAAIVSEKWLDQRTFDVTVKSPALHTTAPIRVIVPKGWSKTAKRTYPVVYAFHGGRNHYTSWFTDSDLAKTAAAFDTMVVMPEGGWNGSYANWFNHGHGGTPEWETFHIQEVIQLMERDYRAGTDRAAMGISSGAEGAMTYAVRHPGLFKYVASFSGILHLTQPGIPAVVMALGLLDGSYDPFAIWGYPKADLANWQAHDPYVLAQRLRGTGLYVSAGTTGNPGPLDPKNLSLKDLLYYRVVAGFTEQMVGSASTSFAVRLRRLGIPVTTDLYGDGWHSWAYWNVEYKKAWPLVMKAIGAKRS